MYHFTLITHDRSENADPSLQKAISKLLKLLLGIYTRFDRKISPFCRDFSTKIIYEPHIHVSFFVFYDMCPDFLYFHSLPDKNPRKKITTRGLLEKKDQGRTAA